MERFEPGNKHKIGGRGAQPSQPCVAQWHCWGCPGSGLDRGGCLSAGTGLGEWTVAVSFEEQPPAVPCASLFTHHHQMCYLGVESCSDGNQGSQRSHQPVAGGGNGHWQRKLEVSGWKMSVGRRVSVLAWNCARSEISSHPAGAEPGGQVALSMGIGFSLTHGQSVMSP